MRAATSNRGGYCTAGRGLLRQSALQERQSSASLARGGPPNPLKVGDPAEKRKKKSTNSRADRSPSDTGSCLSGPLLQGQLFSARNDRPLLSRLLEAKQSLETMPEAAARRGN